MLNNIVFEILIFLPAAILGLVRLTGTADMIYRAELRAPPLGSDGAEREPLELP